MAVGDSAAFTALYHRHKAYVYRVARRFSLDDALAQDALQDTFAYLVRKLTEPGFKLTAQITTLLYPVAKHSAQALTRKHRPPAPEDNALERAVSGGPGEDPRETLSALFRGQGLPEGQREVLLLRFVDDLSLQAIADRLGIPVGTVKSRLSKAIQTLRDTPGLRDFFKPGEPYGWVAPFMDRSMQKPTNHPKHPSHTAHTDDASGLLPQELIAALNQLDEPPSIDASIDQSVLADAVGPLSFACRRRSRRVIARIGTGLAAAACLGIVALLFDVEITYIPDQTAVSPTALVDDLNADGAVNILDAYLMQQAVDQGTGAYSTEDIARLRRQIVQVSG